jgi:hypothetical protein
MRDPSGWRKSTFKRTEWSVPRRESDEPIVPRKLVKANGGKGLWFWVLSKKGRVRRLGNLETPTTIRSLHRKRYRKAKNEPADCSPRRILQAQTIREREPGGESFHRSHCFARSCLDMDAEDRQDPSSMWGALFRTRDLEAPWHGLRELTSSHIHQELTFRSLIS